MFLKIWLRSKRTVLRSKKISGKGYSVIHDDFLSFEGLKTYELIAANFLFSNGDKHLAKAIKLLERTSGELRCIVNAETLKNPWTELRQVLAAYLEKHQARIEYKQNAFLLAERKTGVEVAVIKLRVNFISLKSKNCRLLKGLVKCEDGERGSITLP